MLKRELTDRLDAALALLEKGAEAKRIPAKLRDEFAHFVEETRGAREAAETRPGESLWRLGEITNAKTGGTVLAELRKDGGLSPSDAERLGVAHADEWDEVRARTRVEAREKIQAGEGTRFKRSGKGKVVAVETT